MFIELKKIPEGSSNQITEFLLSETLAELGSTSQAIAAEVTYRKFNTLIVVEINYTTTFTTGCARCLKPLTQELSGSISFTLGMAEDEELASENVDFYQYEYDQERVEFTQSLYDDIVTRIPIRVLCNENCEGFSLPQSTETKHVEVVETKEPDARWVALKNLNNID